MNVTKHNFKNWTERKADSFYLFLQIVAKEPWNFCKWETIWCVQARWKVFPVRRLFGPQRIFECMRGDVVHRTILVLKGWFSTPQSRGHFVHRGCFRTRGIVLYTAAFGSRGCFVHRFFRTRGVAHVQYTGGNFVHRGLLSTRRLLCVHTGFSGHVGLFCTRGFFSARGIILYNVAFFSTRGVVLYTARFC